jgi:hypothetical protein
MKIQGVMAALAMLGVAAAHGREPEVDGYEAYELPAYTIVSHDERKARPIPWLTARLDGVLATLLNRSTTIPSAPTYVVLMPESVWVHYLQPGQGLDSEFVSTPFANYLLLSNARDQSQLSREIFHEYSHWFLHTQFGGIVPMWFDEGIANFVESAEFRGAKVTLGEPDTDMLQPMGWIPMEQLLVMDKGAREYLNLATTAVVQRESWALVHRGLVLDRDFGKQMFALLDAQNDLQPPDIAVRSAFDMTISELDRTVHSYLTSTSPYLLASSFKVLRLPIEPVAPVSLPAGRAMAREESLGLIADIMLASGFNPEALPEVVGALQRTAPDSATTLSLRMRIAARAGADADLEQLLAKVDASKADPKLLRGAGLALYERVGDPVRADFVNRSFELLDRALASRPDDAEAVWAYTVLAAHLKRDLPTAARRITDMRARRPFNPYLAQAAALVHQAAGDTEKMQAALRETLSYSKTAEVTGWARKRLEKTAGD